jgi:hypothetical protein
LLGAVGDVKAKGAGWLNEEGVFGVDPALGTDGTKRLLFGGLPKAKEVLMVGGAAAAACPKENTPPEEDGVVGPASAGFWAKEKAADVFCPNPPNPRALFSCLFSGLAAKGIDAEVLGGFPNENVVEPP